MYLKDVICSKCQISMYCASAQGDDRPPCADNLREIRESVRKLRDAFKRWNDIPTQAPSDELLNEINNVIQSTK